MNSRDLDAMMKSLAPVFSAFVSKAIDARTAPLIARIQELEQKPAAMVYRGIWSGTSSYEIGDVTTDASALWFCQKANTNERPNQSAAWKLILKRGKDAR